MEGIFYAEGFASIPDKSFDAADYGAVGDGKTLNTQAIQQAIDAAAEAGGGKVIFPAGTYVSGALFLKSNVELHLAEDVVIQAIQDDAHFPDKWTRVAGIEMDWPAALVNIYEQENVRISGKGVIDGNGKYWWDKFWGDPPRSGGMWVDYTERDIRWAVDYDCKRVRPVVVYKSKEVVLEDFTVKRAGFWTISLTFSNQVYVNGVTIRNNIGGFGPSSDGINTDSSKDILVENCDIDCNDDNLCIKAGRDSDGLRVNRPAENIVYRNCITRSGHGLFTIGSETSGGMRNVEVYGLEAQGTNTGIRFKSAKVRGGLIENISFHDIKMTDVARPFQFELNWYPEYSYPTIPDKELKDGIPRHWKVMTTPVEPPEKGIPEFRNIQLKNITVEGAERGFYANAFIEKPIHDLHWENITIEAKEGGSLNGAANWTMENVVLKTNNDEFIQMTNTESIELPEWIPASGKSAEAKAPVAEQITRLTAATTSTVLIPVNPASQSLIQANDTTTFSENMEVYILKDEAQQIQYYEPLGDGFYFSPVTISQQGGSISVKGERKHGWTFRIRTADPPKTVNGADEWAYDAQEKLLVVQKTGMQFEIVMSD
ncbi:hypothetical protein CRP01_08685 [Flavilitoribacter nigricans DSM 23189 = NBRC 102662]|uniref:Rhamnogalacturonase A/B/Epimerase-like pectate lyase domain-containing protein n=2 Tax=Flavilitoribacter TaxID=2762562 RepID=A0A2D0NFA6_FLAN2|nr:hypothetical protein CRP01_08685 [Flavilitoribacter nigricans DSM 23189 = NBRC 102662]